MQHMYDVEWFGKTVRLYISKVEKLDWSGKAWDTKYVLMAKKEWEDVVDNGNGIPNVNFFHRDVAISDEFNTVKELQDTMQSIMAQARERYQRYFGSKIPVDIDWALLDLFKFSRVDALDVETTKEKATEDMAHTRVLLCLGAAQERELDDYEAAHKVHAAEAMRHKSYLDPYHDSPPAYKERN